MKRTYSPSKLKKAKKHGFISRTKTSKRKKTIKRRIIKGRKKIV